MMKLNKTAIKAAVAALALFAGVGMAVAAPGVATTNVNVRSGPSSGYSAVDTLRRGERVDVTSCRDGWCFVEKPGLSGWVSANYIDSSRGTSQPEVTFEFNFGNAPVYSPPYRPGPDRGWDRDRRHGSWDRGRDDRGGWGRDDRRGRGWDDRWDYRR